jgi:hypothetical protein
LGALMTFNELALFLQNAHWPRVPERRATFFSIAGFPHYENVMSNVYQFFFSTESPHGLGTLCLDALGDVLQEKLKTTPWPEHEFKQTHVRRELRTNNEKRLDLLLHNGSSEHEWQDATTLVLIENKVNHWLNNDLGEYWKFVEQPTSTCRKIGIVLGLKHEPIPEHWQNDWRTVTHLEWARAVEKRLGASLYRAEPRYVTLLLELIENIRHMSATDNFQSLQFFQQYRDAIFQAQQVREEALYLFPEALRQSLPDYEMKGSNAESRDCWLVIYRRTSNRFKYLIEYRELFYEDKKVPTYRIQLLNASVSAEEAKEIQNTLLEQSAHLFKTDEAQPHQILIKTYELHLGSNKALAKTIAASIMEDWQPLEKYWLS